MMYSRASSIRWSVFAVALLSFGAISVCSADRVRARSDVIAQGGTPGIGLGGGTITSGITGKYYFSSETAVQGFIGSWRGFAFSLSADFLYEFADLVEASEGRLFFGIGGGVGFADTYDEFFGSFLVLNGVFELGWHFSEVPLEIVIDVRPTFLVGSAIDFYGRYAGFDPFGFGIAFRWFFPG